MGDYEHMSTWTFLSIRFGRCLGKLFVFLFKLSIEGYKSTYRMLKNFYVQRENKNNTK